MSEKKVTVKWGSISEHTIPRLCQWNRSRFEREPSCIQRFGMCRMDFCNYSHLRRFGCCCCYCLYIETEMKVSRAREPSQKQNGMKWNETNTKKKLVTYFWYVFISASFIFQAFVSFFSRHTSIFFRSLFPMLLMCVFLFGFGNFVVGVAALVLTYVDC